MTALDVAVARRIGDFDLDVAFTLESGILVLFGPSGAGKSLTLSLIAGLLRPDTGTIAINGEAVTDSKKGLFISPQRRRVGMVFQDGLLLPHRTVLDNVALAVRQTSGRGPRRAIARSWLEKVGAEDLAERRPGSLSGGQRQRVALARGLAGEPSLVLLDEPLSALDHAVRLDLRQLIRDVIVSSGIPAVLVTHDLDEADELADVVVGYNEGRVTGVRVAGHPSNPDPPPRSPESPEPS
ncbi:MAG TPA: ATP-binding cassette domain-containing protein [Acidimicrobiales bacterium]|nr:ATP-binding cassette domain-containing protein [Acidimicrobiales bacterium]